MDQTQMNIAANTNIDSNIVISLEQCRKLQEMKSLQKQL